VGIRQLRRPSDWRRRFVSTLQSNHASPRAYIVAIANAAVGPPTPKLSEHRIESQSARQEVRVRKLRERRKLRQEHCARSSKDEHVRGADGEQ